MDRREVLPELKITFVVAVNDSVVFEKNFLASPFLSEAHDHEIIVQKSFASAPMAYNDALGRSSNDLFVFCHQDMYFPKGWLKNLKRALDYLTIHDPNWGVLGCSGMTVDRQHPRYLYSSGLGVSGAPLQQPKAVQTLDEIVLIMRKSSGLRFDDLLPYYHLYGTDICLQAAKLGMKSYVISAFCIHNTHQPLVLPAEFYKCCEHIRRRWRDRLPIQTTCIRITRSNFPIYLRRLHELHLRYLRRRTVGGVRCPNVRSLFEQEAGAELARLCEQVEGSHLSISQGHFHSGR